MSKEPDGSPVHFLPPRRPKGEGVCSILCWEQVGGEVVPSILNWKLGSPRALGTPSAWPFRTGSRCQLILKPAHAPTPAPSALLTAFIPSSAPVPVPSPTAHLGGLSPANRQIEERCEIFREAEAFPIDNSNKNKASHVGAALASVPSAFPPVISLPGSRGWLGAPVSRASKPAPCLQTHAPSEVSRRPLKQPPSPPHTRCSLFSCQFPHALPHQPLGLLSDTPNS